MSIQVSGTTVIDNSRNICNVGVANIGSVCINGTTGDICTTGTVTACGVSYPLCVTSFSPTNNAANVAISTTFIMQFNQPVGIASTGYINFHKNSINGLTAQSFCVGQVYQDAGPNSLTLRADMFLACQSTIYPVIPPNFVYGAGGATYCGLNTSGGDSYCYNTVSALGNYVGGYLICESGGVQWIVAPSSSQVSRCWYDRYNATTTAYNETCCTGWFIPTISQLGNPGHNCKTYWDSYSQGLYWSNSQIHGDSAWAMRFADSGPWPAGSQCFANKNSGFASRAFRCVTY